MKQKRDLVEISGYAANDHTEVARSLWELGACPFTSKTCIKTNHDQTIVYGTCSVTSPHGEVIICPNRFYANKYQVLHNLARECFENFDNLYLYEDFVNNRTSRQRNVVALGQNSGREISVRGSSKLSMDWVLALIEDQRLIEYTGVEVQSLDITGNYRDAWYGYKNKQSDTPRSEHGLNWANVHKRLIPQLIRKGVVYAKSEYVNSGLHFVLPEVVYKKFEEVIGSDITVYHENAPDHLTVLTYKLEDKVEHGEVRALEQVRNFKVSLDEFAKRFIQGATLPSSSALDNAIKNMLNLT